MKKINALLAVLLMFGNYAKAQNCQNEKEDAGEEKLKSSFSQLVNAGAIVISEDETVVVHPEFIEQLKKSGTVLQEHSRISTICIGPAQ